VKAVAVVTLGVVLLLAASASAASGPPAGLSNRGRVLWNFEALLHDTFGNGYVCTKSHYDFVGGDCSPLATWAPYFYVFAGARHSRFHLSARRPSGFGVHPGPVLIRGRFIACDPRERTFLIEYTDAANLAVDCVEPRRR
jgi:hypothetical protein